MSEYLEALRAGAEAMGLALADADAVRMAAHHALVLKWAKKINLTTVVEPVRAASVHGLDSLLFAEVIGGPDPDAEAITVDVGSGGGFPGVVLAIVRREPIVLLEPIRKRASFLRTVVAELALAHASVVEGKLTRDGLPVAPPHRIVSRATIPPLDLIRLGVPALAPGGALVLSGGANAPDVTEIAAAADAAGGVHERRRSFVLPTGERRFLDVVLTRSGSGVLS